ncbi:MAG: GGDEF domain-containing protein [Lachnospiraceae bacterium]|nr:GGDEF domain-containing protein [Lachnospiraceae bacterium]MBR6486544.1 GGDEF domain-containing protein [Lachnospiraceae bacterium]
MDKNVYDALRELMKRAATEDLERDSYKEICESVKVAKMYYDMDLGDSNRYVDPFTGQLVVAQRQKDDKIILYDSGDVTDMVLTYPYYYNGYEYVHAYIEFRPGIKKDDLDAELYQMLADTVYTIVSRRNMRVMLDFAEKVDLMTGIPNVIAFKQKYLGVTASVPAYELIVMRINMMNFRYINESAGAQAGNEAIISLARQLVQFVANDEAVCRLGGDNFALFIYEKNLDKTLNKLNNIIITDLPSAPGRTFELSSWVGISMLEKGEDKSYDIRLSNAAMACEIGKARLKRTVTFFDAEVAAMINTGRDMIAKFRPALRNNEFLPYFQPKVNMRTGELAGFEALCRWRHGGKVIYPDQFIPLLDREGVVTELDMHIFSMTCGIIRKWKDMGLNAPTISCNFSKKNLFVKDIEDKIFAVVKEHGVDPADLEIEITESMKESEYDRLIGFVRTLKSNGFHISIDDFGTGYSSLSLIHNIDADVIKIDKSFIDTLPQDTKSAVLIESVVSIASRLNMSTIAEGVETAEQGRCLLGLGCHMAQGFYYSRPVSYEEATDIVRTGHFEALIQMD